MSCISHICGGETFYAWSILGIVYAFPQIKIFTALHTITLIVAYPLNESKTQLVAAFEN